MKRLTPTNLTPDFDAVAGRLSDITSDDLRFMAATIRYARRHLGLTGTNPSVGTLIVRNDGDGAVIVGRGVTAIGGRPHAEPQALAEAGELARGATAYVTLEPCAHHGRTPPCADALVTAGVARVVVAATDPDARVSGKGLAILRNAGIRVDAGILSDDAVDQLSGYLIRSSKKRPEVTLKLALSADGRIGKTHTLQGHGQVAITGPVSRAQTHIMRAEADVILVGIGTALADDPVLDCRLPGLEHRSPVRIILDSALRLPVDSRLVRSSARVPLWLACSADVDQSRKIELQNAGCRIVATESDNGLIALPELLDDLAALGIATVLVEGGAGVAKAFLAQGLVDRIALFRSDLVMGDGLAVDGLQTHIEHEFVQVRSAFYGADSFVEYVRKS